MLPTFVIGLREGLEAALIVGMIAAFLRRRERRDLLVQMAVGVVAAIVLCIGVGVALEALSRGLPQRQQEGLETVIAVLAVGMVTYMVVWMKENSRGLKSQLEGAAEEAMGSGGSGRSRGGFAMVAMAFLAVLREGFETVVFLLAAFNEDGADLLAPVGALAGILVAVALGYGIYRGGVRIDLSKFFRATGLVLVFVAAGLVVSALRTAHEAGWLNVGQQQVLDLSWLVRPGSVVSSLLTGMLGIQAHPTAAEVIGWLLYLVPVGLFVAWPPGRGLPPRTVARVLAAGALAVTAAGAATAILAPAAPDSRPVTEDGPLRARLVSAGGATATVHTRMRDPLDGSVGPAQDFELLHTGTTEVGGVAADVYATTMRGPASGPPTLSVARAAELDGGRLPVGAVRNDSGGFDATYRLERTLTVTVEPKTGRVLQVEWAADETARVPGPGGGTIGLATPVRSAQAGLSGAARASAVDAARVAVSDIDLRRTMTAIAWLLCCLGAAQAAGGMALAGAQRRASVAASAAPARAREPQLR